MMNCGFPLSRSFAMLSASRKCLHVLAVDFLHVEAVGLETLAGVFALRFLRHRVERDGVRVVNQDQIIEPEMARRKRSLPPKRLPANNHRRRGK